MGDSEKGRLIFIKEKKINITSPFQSFSPSAKLPTSATTGKCLISGLGKEKKSTNPIL